MNLDLDWPVDVMVSFRRAAADPENTNRYQLHSPGIGQQALTN